ncbi:hypothetical protein DH2020_043530 [Rehmannia glutinosa]|uniref:AP2/ERF domain-containing protein n=1 Tax=Rehmannia glutinosa TaxID=99300 RepID=A0ABR0UL32_REHGL
MDSDSSVFHDFSSDNSSFNSSESSFPSSWEWDSHIALPFNENDSQEMLLFGVLSEVEQHPQAKEIDEVNSSSSEQNAKPTKEKSYRGAAALAYDQAAFSMRGPSAILNFPVERVRDSMREMRCFVEEDGCSPVMALKRKHSMRRRNCGGGGGGGKGKGREVKVENVVVFEDLGADYLEELLSNSSVKASPW